MSSSSQFAGCSYVRAIGLWIFLAGWAGNDALTATPFAHTQSAAFIQTSAAVLNGMAVPNGDESSAWFEWGRVGEPLTTTSLTNIGAGSSVLRVSLAISNLLPRTTYQGRLVVSNSQGIVRGAMRWFGSGAIQAWGSYNPDGELTVPAGLTNGVAVAGGESYSMALRSDGSVLGWGKIYNGYSLQTMFVPAGMTNVTAIASGPQHVIALRTNGILNVWGVVVNPTGTGWVTATVPASATNIIAFDADYYHTLALRADGTVVAWGWNSSGQTNVPPGLSNVVEVAAGQGFSLALKHDGTIVPWGAYYNGTGSSPMYVPPGLTDVTTIAGAGHAALALRRDGTVAAWGYAGDNQTNLPAGLTNIIAITGGNIFCAALRTDGTVIAWGNGWSGQTNVPVGLNAMALSGTPGHLLAVGNIRPQVQAQEVSGPANSDLRINLSGSDANGDALTFRILSLPTAGTLYQFDQDTASRGAMISSVGTIVSDLGRSVIFAPATNGFGSPYATFDFVANDGQDDSDSASVTVNLRAEPRAYTLAPLAIRATSATLHGMALAEIIPGVAWIEWGPRGEFNHSSPTSPVSGANFTYLTTEISDLAAGSTYQCRVVVSNLTGIHHGPVQLFTTGSNVSVWGQQWNGQAFVRVSTPPGLTNVVAAVGGGDYNLAQRADSSVMAWGDNSYGTTNLPPDLGDVAALSAGNYHALALRTDGTVVAWGNNSENELTVPPGLTNVIAVTAGNFCSFALRRDGTIVNWGSETEPTGLENVVAFALSSEARLALHANGTITAWGYSGFGITTPPEDLTNAVAIAMGSYHALALRADGTVTGWGYNANGQATPPGDLSNVVAIAAGSYHSLALCADGTVVAWGDENYDQTPAPAGLTNAITVAGGSTHSIALSGNLPPFALAQTVFCAANHDSVISLSGGDPNGDPLNFRITSLPVKGNLFQYNSGGRGAAIANANTAVSDPAGRVIFAPITNESGLAYASFRFLANDAQYDSAATNVMISIVGQPYAATQAALPVQATNATLNAAVIANGFDTTVWFEWGHRGWFNQTTPPIVLPSGGDFVHVSTKLTNIAANASYQFRIVASNAAAVVRGATQWFTTGGRAVAWGANFSGLTNIPPGLSNVVAVANGTSHNVALQSDGAILVWGDNTYEQTSVPPGISNVISVATGTEHTLVLLSDGTVRAWGYNNYGQTDVPAGLSNVIALAGGSSHSLALLTNGTIVAWGIHNPGEGTYPVTPPAGVTNIVAIAAGGAHSLVLQADGTVIAWGDNYAGQINVPPELSNVVAIAAGGRQSLALQADGTLVGWGNTSSQVSSVSNIMVMDCGWYHGGGLNSAGVFTGWGYNIYGQADSPPGLSNLVALVSGGFHNLAIIGSNLPQSPLLGLHSQNGTPQLELTGQSGRSLTVQTKTDLGNAWLDWTNVTGSGALQLLPLNSLTNQSPRYFRAFTQ